MTILLTLVVLVLVAISIWQITKIFELSQPKKENTQVADDGDNRWNGQLMFAFLIFIYAITLFSFWKWGDVLLPKASSEHGLEYDNLMWISFAIIFFTQTITQALLHYFAYKYRGEKGKKALFYADNDRLEAIWTIIPVIALAGLILYGLYTWTDIMTVEENEDSSKKRRARTPDSITDKEEEETDYVESDDAYIPSIHNDQFSFNN